MKQNHKDVVENRMLTDTDPVSVSVNFKVPVLGDGLTEEDSYVRKGDTAVIELATKYKLADTASPSFALTRKVEENGGSREVKIGSLRIVTDTDANKVYAHIVFDGDDEAVSYTHLDVYKRQPQSAAYRHHDGHRCAHAEWNRAGNVSAGW